MKRHDYLAPSFEVGWMCWPRWGLGFMVEVGAMRQPLFINLELGPLFVWFSLDLKCCMREQGD
jgi:hypothetical protein